MEESVEEQIIGGAARFLGMELTEEQRQGRRVDFGISLRIIDALRSDPGVIGGARCIRANQLEEFSAEAAYILHRLGGMAAAW